MKAPEKIYADPEVFSISDEFNDLLQTKEEGCIEYTRTDAFIEKACELLVNCIEDFMARRMEIWDKECKKQTLENIHKKLEE